MKILSIVVDNFYKRLLQKKLYKWRKNAIKEPEKVIIEPEQPNIFDTLKKVKDIISFNDYLRNVTVNKYGKTFLDKLNKTRNPILQKRFLRKLIKRKIISIYFI